MVNRNLISCFELVSKNIISLWCIRKGNIAMDIVSKSVFISDVKRGVSVTNFHSLLSQPNV